MNQEELNETKVILKFGYHMKLVVTMKSATQILAILSGENILKFDSHYSTGKSVDYLAPWGTEEVTIALISPAELMLKCAAAPEVK